MPKSLLYQCSPEIYWPKTIEVAELPLVTCIMPTANRQEFIPKAVKYFLEQDYPYKELIIIDDGLHSVLNLIPNLYCLRYVYLPQSLSIGTKRNIACEKASGSIIMHWDDDDWYAPNWITYQVNAMLNAEADICGLSHVQFYSIKENRYYIKKNTDAKRNWLCGATLAYRKSFWNKNPFRNIHIGEDILFVRNKNASVFAHGYFEGFLAIVHADNVRIRES